MGGTRLSQAHRGVPVVASRKQTATTVLHLSGSFGFYGSEQVIVNLARYADLSQWRPVVACLLDPRCTQSQMLRSAQALGIETVAFHLRGRYDPEGIRHIRSCLVDRQVGVIHCHGYKSNGYGLLAACGLPVARISTAHGYSTNTLPVRVYEGFDKWVFLRGYHRLIAVSEPIRGHLSRRGHRSEKIVVIPNGLDLSRFPFRLRRSAGPLPVHVEDQVIGSVGRLSPEKGHTYLLAAAARVLRERPRAIFVLVGTGRAEAALRQQAADLGIGDRVLFTGVRSDVPALLAQFDVFILPSLTEGLPMAALEAMAVGVPVIATAVGDVPKVVRQAETGVLVAPGEAAELAAAILSVMSHPEEAAIRARAARALVEREHSARTMAARTEAVYAEVLESLGLRAARA
jgi:glycosyltransferase involved in cell wall biosynthesis